MGRIGNNPVAAVPDRAIREGPLFRQAPSLPQQEDVVSTAVDKRTGQNLANGPFVQQFCKQRCCPVSIRQVWPASRHSKKNAQCINGSLWVNIRKSLAVEMKQARAGSCHMVADEPRGGFAHCLALKRSIPGRLESGSKGNIPIGATQCLANPRTLESIVRIARIIDPFDIPLTEKTSKFGTPGREQRAGDPEALVVERCRRDPGKAASLVPCLPHNNRLGLVVGRVACDDEVRVPRSGSLGQQFVSRLARGRRHACFRLRAAP